MKKSKSFSGVESLPEKASARKLSQAEMEYEIDHCPAPWRCPEACYRACGGCQLKEVEVDEHMEMRADLIRKYGGG